MADAGVEVALGTPSRTTGIFGERHTAGCRFTGTGSEYFRIWIVNLLVESMLEVQAGTVFFGFTLLVLFGDLNDEASS